MAPRLNVRQRSAVLSVTTTVRLFLEMNYKKIRGEFSLVVFDPVGRQTVVWDTALRTITHDTYPQERAEYEHQCIKELCLPKVQGHLVASMQERENKNCYFSTITVGDRNIATITIKHDTKHH